MYKEKRIIVVEDLAIVSLALQNFLSNNGYSNVKVFSSGRDAIENINLKKPDLALLDVHLKDEVSGVEVAGLLKKLNIPFIFISAFSDPDHLDKAKRLKPVKIFTKPISMSSLLTEVNRIFN